mgnify:CR=1 FL=1
MLKSIKNASNVKIGVALADNSSLYCEENAPLAKTSQLCAGIDRFLYKSRKSTQIDSIQTLCLSLTLLVTYLERVKFEKPPFLVVEH